MTTTEINTVCQCLIAVRDGAGLTRGDRDMLADACNALDGYAKLVRAVEAMQGNAPAKEPSAEPTVGFNRHRTDSAEHFNDLLLQAFNEGHSRGMWDASKLVEAI